MFEGEQLIAAYHAELGRGHAEALLPAIAAFPECGRAARILVDVGPGSFTGVRVGLAAARALGFAWGVPVCGYDCLDLVAAIVRADDAPSHAFVVAMIGGHGELFWKRADPSGRSAHEAPQSTPIDELATLLAGEAVYGSGAPRLGLEASAAIILPDARRVGLLDHALRSLAPSPLYGRGADAKPMAQPPQ